MTSLARVIAVFAFTFPFAVVHVADAEPDLELAAAATGTTSVATSQAGGAATVAWHLPALRLGATIDLARGGGYLAGYAFDDVTALSGVASAHWRAIARDGIDFELGAALGARVISTAMPERALVLGGELEARGVFGRGRVRGTLGAALPIWIAVRPTAEPDELAQLVRGGVEITVADDLWLTALGEIGGTFGYDGDGAKVRAGARVGLAWRPGRAPATSRPRSAIGAFVAAEWRAFALADHASHGPGLAAGITLFSGALELGLLAHGRPGPINPATFAVMPVDGQTYRGESTLALRSDGNFIGIVVAPAMRVGPARLRLPVAFGQAAYGFYLAGDDRETPDGARVSEWEDRLFAGKDSSFALGGELGVSVALPVRPWLEPYLALRYGFTIGYDTLVRDDYNGPSIGLGVQLSP